MSTHLVISDAATLLRMIQTAKGLEPVYDDTVPLGAWLPFRQRHSTRTWLFRTPDARTDFESVEFAYCDRPEGHPGLRLVMPFKRWGESVLPLIAACDLLGIEEL